MGASEANQYNQGRGMRTSTKGAVPFLPSKWWWQRRKQKKEIFQELLTRELFWIAAHKYKISCSWGDVFLEYLDYSRQYCIKLTGVPIDLNNIETLDLWFETCIRTDRIFVPPCSFEHYDL